jgi:UDP-GlcNAc3NAcA epimerase
LKKKVFSIVGARPQFVKVAAIHRAIKNHNILEHFILHTGQHYDHELSDIFFNELEIPKPHFHLNLFNELNEWSVENMQKEIADILIKERPDLVIVYGDTNSTLAGALAAKMCNIKIAHVEAGLRSYNLLMPEEYNRIETDNISDILFCPTAVAVNNLKSEKDNKSKNIILSGDIMFDSFKFYADKIATQITSPFILCTIHRNTLLQSDVKLQNVLKALNNINQVIPLVLPAHPRLKKVISHHKLKCDFSIIEPVGYLQMIKLLKSCRLVITDSGGLQKEAFFSKKICLSIREETEWTELVEAGVNFLAGDSFSERIMATFYKAMNAPGNFTTNFYGDANAAKIIIQELSDFIKKDSA